MTQAKSVSKAYNKHKLKQLDLRTEEMYIAVNENLVARGFIEIKATSDQSQQLFSSEQSELW